MTTTEDTIAITSELTTTMVTANLPARAETKEIREAVMDISPNIARAWLVRNRKTRPYSEKRVSAYAKEMIAGKYMFDGTARTVFDWNGALVNGQHILNAIIISGVTVKVGVTWGVSPLRFVRSRRWTQAT